VWTVGDAEARRVIAPDPAGIDLATLATPEAVNFAARDGVALGGLLYRPAGATGPVPVFLRLHGGPTSHARADWKPVAGASPSALTGPTEFSFNTGGPAIDSIQPYAFDAASL